MKRNVFLVVLLSALVAFGSGCGLLGLQQTVSGSKTQVEETMHILAGAAETKDLTTLEAHLADSIITQFAVDTRLALANLNPQDKQELMAQVEAIWADKEMHRVALSLGSVEVDRDTAQVKGAFNVRFADAAGNESECSGTGSAGLVSRGGRWLITQVDVKDGSCTVNGGPPPEPAPSPDPQPNPQPPPGSAAPQAFFDRCAYLLLGASGKQVAFLQESLDYLGYGAGNTDGNYTSTTADAVRKFQTAYGFYVDGEVGRQTIDGLDAALKEKGGSYGCGIVEAKPPSPSADMPPIGPPGASDAYLASLTVDFSERDAMPETNVPKSEWDSWGKWGPPAAEFPPAEPPSQYDPIQWKRDRIVAAARKYVGQIPYAHKHIPSLGLDCSNFTAWVYNYALGQKFTSSVGKQGQTVGRRLAPDEQLEPGDLLFFGPSESDITHAGIYAGPGYMIDESDGNVRVMRFPYGWTERDFLWARRVIM